MATISIDELINTLDELVEDAWALPLGGGRCVVDRERLLDLLDEIRAGLPGDLKMAQEIVDKRNDIIAAAKAEYDALKQQAEDYAKQRLNEHDLTVEAKRKAAEIIAAAENSARDIMRVANEYCDDAMKRTEEALGQTLQELKQSRVQFRQAGQERMR